MRFYIVPVETLKEIDSDWETRRTNVDGTEALIHDDIFLSLLPQPLSDDTESQEIPYASYDSNSTEFKALITSDEWVSSEENIQ